MALISAVTILTSLSLFHITLAFFFFTNPAAIADQALVWVLGEATGMPSSTRALFFAQPSPLSALLAVALLLVGLSDLMTLSMPEEVWRVHHWGAQAPARIAVFAGAAGSSLLARLLSSSSSPSSSSSSSSFSAAEWYARRRGVDVVGGGGAAGGAGAGAAGSVVLLVNDRVFFTVALLELLGWLWVWATLREEAGEFAARKSRRRRSSAGGPGVRER
ncbi:increased loss of mitochondrial DNA protein 1 [Xylariaceae sp. FL0804]|nr:increased loss of mitochondrial DNA protein 1 [Xylariaceae sp. FL0804]